MIKLYAYISESKGENSVLIVIFVQLSYQFISYLLSQTLSHYLY